MPDYFVVVFCIAYIVMVGSYLALPTDAKIIFFLKMAVLMVTALSVFVVDRGEYVAEQYQTTYFTGASLRFVLYFIVFFMGMHAVHHGMKLLGRTRPRDVVAMEMAQPLARFAVVVSGEIMALLALNMAISGGIPLLQPGTILKQNYLETTRLYPIVKYFGFALPLPIICGASIYVLHKAGDRTWRTLGLMVHLAYIVYLILMGFKFGGITNSIFFLAAPWLIDIAQRRSFWFMLKRVAIVIAFIIPPFVYLIITHYERLRVGGVSDPFEILYIRVFVLQGHLFWGVDNYVLNHTTDSYFLHLGKSLDVMREMMLLIGGRYIETPMENGTRFTGGFPSGFVLIYGHLLTIPMVFAVGAMYYAAMRVLINAILRRDVIFYSLGGYILLRLYSILGISNLDVLISPSFFGLIFVLLLYAMVMRAHHLPFMGRKMADRRLTGARG